MSIRIQSINALQEYFRGVVARADHHSPGVNEIIYPLLGLIVLNVDDDSEIEVRQYRESPANMLWVYIRGNRYAFRYEHSDQTIRIHSESLRGDVLHSVNNATGTAGLRTIFASL